MKLRNIALMLVSFHATSAQLRAQDTFANRRGSGTSWIPVAAVIPSHTTKARGWTLQLRGAVFGQLDVQSGPRGSTDLGVTSWGSLEASRPIGSGRVALLSMLSLDALGVGEDGFAELVQTGDANNGVTSHDRMLPREFLSELAITYDLPLSSSKHFSVYVAPAGEPALGAPAFTQRPSAMDNPVPPIGFHRQDSPRTSWGVITAGVFADGWKLEASRFNGRQPNANRFNVEKLQLDSYSARLTMRPEDAWSASVGMGHIHAPNRIEPNVSTDQFTAALMNARRIRTSGKLSSTLIYSANKLVAEPFWSHSLMFETTAVLDARNSIVARLERVHKGLDELDLGGDGDAGSAFGSGRYHVGAATVGYIREVAEIRGGTIGAGATGTLYLLPPSFSPSYGSRTPAGAFVFVRVRPAGPH